MSLEQLVIIFAVGEALILLQAFFSFRDGYFSAKQMSLSWKRVGCPFIQNGGMWTEVIIVTTLIAYLIGKYQFKYLSMVSVLVALLSFSLWVTLTFFVFAPAGKSVPGARAHDWHITGAGWIHVVYMACVTWIIAMAFKPLYLAVGFRD